MNLEYLNIEEYKLLSYSQKVESVKKYVTKDVKRSLENGKLICDSFKIDLIVKLGILYQEEDSNSMWRLDYFLTEELNDCLYFNGDLYTLYSILRFLILNIWSELFLGNS